MLVGMYDYEDEIPITIHRLRNHYFMKGLHMDTIGGKHPFDKRRIITIIATALSILIIVVNWSRSILTIYIGH